MGHPRKGARVVTRRIGPVTIGNFMVDAFIQDPPQVETCDKVVFIGGVDPLEGGYQARFGKSFHMVPIQDHPLVLGVEVLPGEVLAEAGVEFLVSSDTVFPMGIGKIGISFT